MTDDANNAGASAPGVAFAYETAKWQIEKQEQSIREVNSRSAFLMAGFLALSAYFFKDIDASKAPWVTLFFAISLGVPVLLAGLSYIPRGYSRAPNPNAIAELANKQPGAIKEAALGSLLAGFEKNAATIGYKNRLFSAALIVGLAAWLLAIGFKGYQATSTIRQESAVQHGKR